MNIFYAVEVRCSSNNRHDRIWRKKKEQCHSKECAHIAIIEEAYNCVNECLSPSCYADIYAKNPLEDGEIDHTRSRLFTACVRKETKAAARNRGSKSGNL